GSDVLGAIRGVKKRLSARTDGTPVQKQLPNLGTEHGPPGLPGLHNRIPALGKRRSKQLQLGCFPSSIPTFKGNEHPAHVCL
ncbi:hypothetical protein OJ587_12145, partial [Streptococcus anginosus]|nr:hypothetical protein [Streptococcus anginosus]